MPCKCTDHYSRILNKREKTDEHPDEDTSTIYERLKESVDSYDENNQEFLAYAGHTHIRIATLAITLLSIFMYIVLAAGYVTCKLLRGDLEARDEARLIGYALLILSPIPLAFIPLFWGIRKTRSAFLLPALFFYALAALIFFSFFVVLLFREFYLVFITGEELEDNSHLLLFLLLATCLLTTFVAAYWTERCRQYLAAKRRHYEDYDTLKRIEHTLNLRDQTEIKPATTNDHHNAEHKEHHINFALPPE